MLSDGSIEGQRVGRGWVIEEHALRLADAQRRPAHRPWSPAVAWAVLALADGIEPQCKPYERHRAAQRLALGLPNILGCLSSRSRKRHFYAHPEERDLIAAYPGVVRTGASVAPEHGIGLVGSGPLHAYLSQAIMQAVSERFVLLEESERPNLWFQVVSDDLWPFPDDAQVAPPAVVAVDLLESEDERCRAAGFELLNRL